MATYNNKMLLNESTARNIFIPPEKKFEGGILESSYGRSVGMLVVPLQYIAVLAELLPLT